MRHDNDPIRQTISRGWHGIADAVCSNRNSAQDVQSKYDLQIRFVVYSKFRVPAAHRICDAGPPALCRRDIRALRQFGNVVAVGNVNGAAGLVVEGLAVVDAQVVEDHRAEVLRSEFALDRVLAH